MSQPPFPYYGEYHYPYMMMKQQQRIFSQQQRVISQQQQIPQNLQEKKEKPHPTENDEGKKAKKQRDRWSSDQTKTLVNLWCQKQDLLNSTRCNVAWANIKEEVDKFGNPKSVMQCKSKIKSLKDQYKKSKEGNKKTGEEPKTSPFYEQFDRILSERNIFTMPEFKEVGQKITEDSEQEQDLPLQKENIDKKARTGKLFYCLKLKGLR